jgi:hypothetical protein
VMEPAGRYYNRLSAIRALADSRDGAFDGRTGSGGALAAATPASRWDRSARDRIHDRLPVGLVARALPRLSVGLLAGELALKPLTPTGRGLKR